MAQPSLSDLCSIWWVLVLNSAVSRVPLAALTLRSYTEIPKYRCPRCKTQTCSLPCYKRHQQRASCSGKRDPAAYLKKSQLATPSSIDRDYNYLKSVERNIDDASADAHERGIPNQHHPSDPQNRGFRREGAFQRYLRDHGIRVEYAPKGLSRQRSNQSRVTKNEQIFWTIEWRDGSGEQDLRHNAPDTTTLSELYRGVQTAKRKRKAVSEAADGSSRTTSKRTKTSEAASGQSAGAHVSLESDAEAKTPEKSLRTMLEPWHQVTKFRRNPIQRLIGSTKTTSTC